MGNEIPARVCLVSSSWSSADNSHIIINKLFKVLQASAWIQTNLSLSYYKWWRYPIPHVVITPYHQLVIRWRRNRYCQRWSICSWGTPPILQNQQLSILPASGSPFLIQLNMYNFRKMSKRRNSVSFRHE